MLRSLFIAAVVIASAGCPSGSQPRPSDNRVKNIEKCKGEACANQAGKAKGTQKLVADCTDSACILDVPSGRHYACLQTAAGRCAHFGAACSPSQDCVYDGETKKYRKCSKMQLGSCLNFAGDCAPAEPCVVDPKDGLFRSCQQPIAGGCRHYGDLCAPNG